jgi:hypothetical protein
MALGGQAVKESSRPVEAKKLRVVILGAHPDDTDSMSSAPAGETDLVVLEPITRCLPEGGPLVSLPLSA